MALDTPAVTRAAACFVLFGVLALRLLYGRQLARGYGLLVIFAVEAALSSGSAVLQQPYMVLHRPGTIGVVHVASLSLGAACVWLPARRFGPEGAACGLRLATAARFALTYVGFEWLLGLRASPLLPTRGDLAALLNRPLMRTA